MKLTYGTYTFTITPPVEKRSSETIFDERGVRVGREETWIITGYLKGDTSALDAASATFDTAFQLDGQELKLTDDAAVVTYESMAPSACFRGPRIASYSFDNSGNGAEWATNRPFSITAKGLIYGNSGVLGVNKYEKRTVWEYDQHGKITRTISGHCYALPPYSALTICQTEGATGLAPTLPAGYNRIHRVFEQGQDDTYCTFSYQDVQYWKAWPENVTGGGYTCSMATSGHQVTKTLAGSFTGKGAAAGIMALKDSLSPADGVLTSEQITPDFFSGSISFSFTWRLPIRDGGYLEFEERITWENAYYDKIFHSTANEVFVESGGLIPGRINQSGSASRYNNPPVAPDPIFPDNIVGAKSITFSNVLEADNFGEILANDDGTNPTDGTYELAIRTKTLYTVSWNYEMKSAAFPEGRQANMPINLLWNGGSNRESL